MVTNREKHSDRTPLKQGLRGISREPNKIGASTRFDFSAKNLTPYGGLLPAATMLEKLELSGILNAHIGTGTSRQVQFVMRYAF